MIFNVAQLMKSPVGTSSVSDLEEVHMALEKEFKATGPLTGHVRMRRVNQGILVDGWVDLTLEQACDRCLNQFEQPIHATFEERFYPTVDILTGTPLPIIEEDDVFEIDEHHQLDLTEAIRQRILLALPMRVVCREECLGLCPQCGRDLNTGPCQCEPEVDNRLSFLKTLLQNATQQQPEQA